MALKLSKNEVQQSVQQNVCDEGNEQKSLEGGGLSIYSSTPNLIAFHPKTTTDCSSNHRRALRAASTQEAHSTRTNVENTVLDAAGLFLAGSVRGVNRRSLYIWAVSQLNFSWTGSSRLLTWLQPRPKTFSTEEKNVPGNLSVFESKPFCFDIGVFNSNNYSLWIFVKTHLDVAKLGKIAKRSEKEVWSAARWRRRSIPTISCSD